MAEAALAVAPVTVLIVDDETFIARAVACILRQLRGAQVRLATDGGEALQLARSLEPDLILVDVHIPGTSSLALCRQLRALPAASRSLLYLFTGLLPDDTEVIPLRGLCDGLISKPPDPGELLAALEAAAAARRG